MNTHAAPASPLSQRAADQRGVAVGRQRDAEALVGVAAVAGADELCALLDERVDPQRVARVARVNTNQQPAAARVKPRGQRAPARVERPQTHVAKHDLPARGDEIDRLAATNQTRPQRPRHTQRDRHRAARCARRWRAQREALLEPERPVLIPLRKRPVGVRDTVPVRARRPRREWPQRGTVANPGQAQRETPGARVNTHARIRKAGRETLRAVDQHKPGTRAPNPERALAVTERARYQTAQRGRQARKPARRRHTRRRARARHAPPNTNQRRRRDHRHPDQQRRSDQHPDTTSPRSPTAHAGAPPRLEGDRIHKPQCPSRHG